MIDNERSFDGEFKYFVRPLDGSISYDLTKLENLLIEKKKLIKIEINNILFSIVNVFDFVNLTTIAISNDPFFLLSNKNMKIR